MAVHLRHMLEIQREAMDHYWKVVRSATDEGLDAMELSWKRGYERDMVRWEEKFGCQYDEIFGKAS